MLRSPQKFFEVGRVSRLTFVFLSVTKPAVRETAFHEALNRMRLSPYFVETCGVNPNAEYSECRVEMKRRLSEGRRGGRAICSSPPVPAARICWVGTS